MLGPGEGVLHGEGVFQVFEPLQQRLVLILGDQHGLGLPVLRHVEWDTLRLQLAYDTGDVSLQLTDRRDFSGHPDFSNAWLEVAPEI